jgi:hypothetical protein
MQIIELIEKLIIQTENRQLAWKESISIGRFEVELKNVSIAIDSNFAIDSLTYRLIIIDKRGSIKNTYPISATSPMFPRIKELYRKVKEYYDDELLKNIIEDM